MGRPAGRPRGDKVRPVRPLAQGGLVPIVAKPEKTPESGAASVAARLAGALLSSWPGRARERDFVMRMSTKSAGRAGRGLLLVLSGGLGLAGAGNGCVTEKVAPGDPG